MGSIQLQTGKGKILGLSSAVVNAVEIDETLTISGAAADAKATGDALAEKVDKVSGKGLSTNDYTYADQAKLSGIEAGAEVNTVKSVCGKTGAVALGKEDVGLGNVDNTADLEKPVSAAMQAALSVKADKITSGGGFVGGYLSSAEGGAAVGSGATAFNGGAVGYQASVETGGAIGCEAAAAQGFSGGFNAKSEVDAIQLGTGTNSVPKSLQVYSHTVMNADGSLPYVHTARPYVEETLPAAGEVLALNTIYDLGTQTSVTLKLPSANVGNFIQVDFLCGDTPATFTIDAASSAIVSDYDFTPEPDKAYSLFFDYGRLAGSLYGWRFSYAEYTYTEV